MWEAAPETVSGQEVRSPFGATCLTCHNRTTSGCCSQAAPATSYTTIRFMLHVTVGAQSVLFLAKRGLSGESEYRGIRLGNRRFRFSAEQVHASSNGLLRLGFCNAGFSLCAFR